MNLVNFNQMESTKSSSPLGDSWKQANPIQKIPQKTNFKKRELQEKKGNIKKR